MAALAVRASEALAAGARPRGLTRGLGIKKVRVVPAHAKSGCGDGDSEVNEKLNQRTIGGFKTASSPSPARNAKKSALMARPPIKRALSTIEEDAE
uniref:Uncharacterized protein n=1 Tax=Arundo donax TaxID=35708 RepID=A0A0A9B2D5_ARUDO